MNKINRAIVALLAATALFGGLGIGSASASTKKPIIGPVPTTSPRDAVPPTRARINPYEMVNAQIARNQDLAGIGPSDAKTGQNYCLVGAYASYIKQVKVMKLAPATASGRKQLTVKPVNEPAFVMDYEKLGWQADATGLVFQRYSLFPLYPQLSC